MSQRVPQSSKWPDAAWVIFVLACALFIFPVLWPREDVAPQTQTRAIYYFFGVWILLIGGARLLATRLVPKTSPDPSQAQDDLSGPRDV